MSIPGVHPTDGLLLTLLAAPIRFAIRPRRRSINRRRRP